MTAAFKSGYRGYTEACLSIRLYLHFTSLFTSLFTYCATMYYYNIDSTAHFTRLGLDLKVLKSIIILA